MDNFLQNKYSNFTEEDFINDPFFQESIIKQDFELEKFWSKFLDMYPGKKETFENAILFLKHLKFEEELPDDHHINQSYLQHLKQVKATEKIFWFKTKTIRRLVSIAALVAGIILIVSIVFLFDKYIRDRQIAIETEFGEIKKVTLPDGSDIVLNAHSDIEFKKVWDENKPREIWLKGEAFFTVKHLNKNFANIKSNERFLVHGENFTIEVLGTSFDIRERRGKTEVVLQEGKIKLTLKDDEMHPIIMKPGDMVSYNTKNNNVVRTTIIPQQYAGWKERKLILNDPTLQEIINYLEDNYGKQIILESQQLKNKKIEGPIELNNLNDALFIISTVLDVDISKKDNIILIRSK